MAHQMPGDEKSDKYKIQQCKLICVHNYTSNTGASLSSALMCMHAHYLLACIFSATNIATGKSL